MIHHTSTLNKTFHTLFLLIAAAFVSFSVAHGQTATPVYSPVILYKEIYNPGRSFEMKEDGSGKEFLPQCPVSGGCGDLSHEGVAGHRFFLRIEPSPLSGLSNDVVVYSEDYGTRTVLVSDKSFHPGASNGGVWSLDGNRIAYYEYWCSAVDANNACIENRSGIVIADVVRDTAGIAPVALVNETRIAEVVSPDALGSPTWAPDTQHLAFSLGRFSGTGTIWHAYWASAPPPGSPDPPTATEISFAGGNNISQPLLRLSPIDRTDSLGQHFSKLAFQRLTDTKPYSRSDIFTVEIPAAYAGGYALTATRITNSTNAKNFWGAGGVQWSPDGQWLAYVAAPYGSFSPIHDVYKIKSDGSSKAVNLTNFKTSTDYSLLGWRR